MIAEIICVGEELLMGNTLNTNAQFLSKRLLELGIDVHSQTVVGDNAEAIKKAVSLALKNNDLVILTGGLGPTEDDITKEAVAEVLGKRLVLHKESLEKIEEYFLKTGRTMPENNKKQAKLPSGSIVIPNFNGTAPGCIVEDGKKKVILLPGPPGELVPMFNNSAAPYLKTLNLGFIKTGAINIFGVGESLIAEKLGELTKSENPIVATYAKNGEVEIRVTVKSDSFAEAENTLNSTIKSIVKIFGENVYGINEPSIQEKVVALLKEQNKKLATAESCTAGILSSMITDVSGSSEVFDMGVTAYSNYIKTHALGVKESTLEQFGAVSADVAVEMANAIRKLTGAHIGVGITGVAGPKSSERKPVGLVYVSVCDDNYNFVRELHLKGTREKIREISSKTALDMVRRYLEQRTEFLSMGTIKSDPLKYLWDYKLPALTKENLTLNDISVEGERLELTDAEVASLMTVDHDDEIILDKKDAPSVLPQDDLYSQLITSLDDGSEYTDADENIERIELEESSAGYIATTEDDIEEPKKKEKKSFFKTFFPQKEDALLEKIRKIIFMLAFVVLIGTIGIIAHYFLTGVHENNIIEKAAEVWENPQSFEKTEDGVFIGFDTLLKENSDIKAWIKIDIDKGKTLVNNPVYQTTNNDYYLNHNMKKETSRYGAIYIDKDSVISKDGNSQNVVIYGHSMADGSMFGKLKSYRDLTFYKQNPIIEFNTLYEKATYKVFAVMLVDASPDPRVENVFHYRYSHFSSEDAFLNFVENVKSRSIIDSGVDVFGDDEIITLSTCAYDFDDARLAVFARKIRPEESTLEITDTSNAKYNATVIYPAAYYGITTPQVSSVVTPSTSENTTSTESNVSSETESTTTENTTTSVESTSSDDTTTSTVTPTSSEPVVSSEPVTSVEPTVSVEGNGATE